MANITKANNNTSNAVSKEVKEMTKANAIINSIVNIETAKHDNKVEVIKRAGCSYLKINDTIVGSIGGSEKEQASNIKCIQFMVDNCDAGENGYVLGAQCNLLARVMANLEKVSLDDTIITDGVEYIIDTNSKRVLSEDGNVVFEMIEEYPELAEVEMTDEAIRAILVGELNKHKIEPVAKHEEETDEGSDEINIESEKKLSVVDTVKGLRALGMSSSWFDVDGIRQPFPICYNGAADLKSFTKIVKDCLDNDKDYLDIILASCRYDENGINPDDEICTIEDVDCVIDYTKKVLYDVNGAIKYADLDDIEYELPKEAIKVMLIQRAKDEIERIASEEAYDEYDEDDDYYDDDECDGCCDDCSRVCRW